MSIGDVLFRQALFGSGLPVMHIPEDGKTTFAIDRILTAWDYSRPAARAVAEAMPLLTKAKIERADLDFGVETCPGLWPTIVVHVCLQATPCQ